MKILLLGSQHGNELLGEKLYRYIRQRRPELLDHVYFKLANPKARRQNIRYIESDMNRSYDPNLNTYESKRAAHILEHIDQQRYDVVLDLHTTTCIQPPCFIIEKVSKHNRMFLTASSIEKVVLMEHDIVRTSLIGTHPTSISIEIAKDDVTPLLLDQLCDDLQRFVDGIRTFTTKQGYPILGLLKKTEIDDSTARSLVNFVPADGFIPVLVGENSYKKNTEYLGFKATKETIITL